MCLLNIGKSDFCGESGEKTWNGLEQTIFGQ